MKQGTVTNNVPPSIDLPKRSNQSVRRRYESEAARSLLEANGLDDLDKLFTLAEQSFYRHKGRTVSRVELHQPTGVAVSAYVKLHWGRRRLIPRTSDMKTGQALQNLPEREWRGIAELGSLGFLVPERLALLQRGWVWFQEAVVIQSVRPPFSWDELIRTGRWEMFSKEDQQGFLEGVVDVMQRIHQAGVGWRGTCTRHFFPEQTPGGTWQFWLIDCEGIHRKVTARNIARDYRKLNRALAISGADAATLNTFERLTERAQQTRSRKWSPQIDPPPPLAHDRALKPST